MWPEKEAAPLLLYCRVPRFESDVLRPEGYAEVMEPLPAVEASEAPLPCAMSRLSSSSSSEFPESLDPASSPELIANAGTELVFALDGRLAPLTSTPRLIFGALGFSSPLEWLDAKSSLSSPVVDVDVDVEEVEVEAFEFELEDSLLSVAEFEEVEEAERGENSSTSSSSDPAVAPPPPPPPPPPTPAPPGR